MARREQWCLTGVKEGLEDKIDAAKTKERRDRGPEKALEHKIPPKKKKKVLFSCLKWMDFKLGATNCRYWKYALNSVLVDRIIESQWKQTSIIYVLFLGHFIPFTTCLPRSHRPYFEYLQWGITHASQETLSVFHFFDYKNILYWTKIELHSSKFYWF